MIVSTSNFNFLHDEGTGQLSIVHGGADCPAAARNLAIIELMRKCQKLESFVADIAEYKGDGSARASVYQDVVRELGELARELLEGV